MMQHTTPLASVTTDPRDEITVDLRAVPQSADRSPTIWVSRVTAIVGAICLFGALFIWAARPGHYRLVLALLIVAMFAAILHSYVFEDG
ncbi:MAG: hypothetical protein M3Z66_00260 [Chloroflexota bacterium]|nr:hypothetical protein [Chloroflexota bacterium]